MSESMDAAVEAGGKALGQHQALPSPWDVDWDEKVARTVLNAARPHLAAAELREAADAALEYYGTWGGAGWATWLRDRADRIEQP